MVASSSALVWLLATACPLLNPVFAQTITVEGEVVQADESNVAPAFDKEGATPIPDPLPEEELQLTDAILANLTELELSNVSLFYFDESPTEQKRSLTNLFKCKTFPGDLFYPNKLVWKVFNLLSGGALIETVPLGAVCYEGEHYDEAKCQDLLASWTNSTTHVNDPTSVMSPLYQGATCQPFDAANGTCEIGGFPSYTLKATNVAQVQLAVNFARNLNLRLVVHNTGHDFLGKSTGAGALSIWTRHMNRIKVIENYVSPSYQGPAFKLGAGVQVVDLYEAAEREGYTAVGGECRTVGVTGGYTAGGGHSPLSPIAGLGSDQVLSIDIVTPDGRFITVTEQSHPDLFWAIRGGGAATWGVVISMTVKVYPKMKFAGLTWATDTMSLNVTEDTFWKAVEAYWRRFPEYSDKRSYGYTFIFPMGPGNYMWTMNPWIIANASKCQMERLVGPLLDEWAEIGFHLQPEFFEYDSFLPAWRNHFPAENVGVAEVRTGSRMIPRKNWEDETLLNDTMRTLRELAQEGAPLIHYNINAAAPDGTPDSAVHPAWRDAVMFVITGLSWMPDATPEQVQDVNERVTHDVMERLKAITPGGGGYGNEGDVMDPDFADSFFGPGYGRLYALKKRIDPFGVFYAPTAVGSEDWYISGQEDWLTLQTGRLCHK